MAPGRENVWKRLINYLALRLQGNGSIYRCSLATGLRSVIMISKHAIA